MPDASQGACDTDRGSHLPRHGLEFLLAALLWGNLTLSETQFLVGQDSERRILLLLKQKLNIL